MWSRREVLKVGGVVAAGLVLSPIEVLKAFAQMPEGVVYNGDQSKPWVALTFDDGFLPREIEKILTIAEDYKLQFTFFPIGDRSLLRVPDLWRQAVSAGHEIGNHSYTHRILNTALLPEDEIWWDVAHYQEVLDQIIGDHVPVNFFRPPGGYVEPAVIRIANEQGLTVVNWSRSSGGTNRSATPDSAFTNVIRARNGDIVLLHTIPNDTVRLRGMIEILLGNDFELVTLSRMFEIEEKQPEEANTEVDLMDL